MEAEEPPHKSRPARRACKKQTHLPRNAQRAPKRSQRRTKQPEAPGWPPREPPEDPRPAPGLRREPPRPTRITIHVAQRPPPTAAPLLPLWPFLDFSFTADSGIAKAVTVQGQLNVHTHVSAVRRLVATQ